MNRIKAIISDFDGTLVDHTHKLTPEVETAIKRFVNSGYIFSIATGRAYKGVIEKHCKLLGTFDLTIVRGGSEIISNKTGRVVWGRYFESNTLDSLINYLQENKLQFAAEQGDYIYTPNGIPHPAFGEGAEFKPISDLPTNNVPKIVIIPKYPENTILPLLDKLNSKYHDIHAIRITSQEGLGIDINDGGAGKHMALLEYAKLLKLDPQEILGVGDSYNDYPLLMACGIKVAMGNSPKELKDIADYVVRTQKENGILEVLDIFLKQIK